MLRSVKKRKKETKQRKQQQQQQQQQNGWVDERSCTKGRNCESEL